ncbi:hypothetical protein B9G98_04095 [Wickerhamiella sorbophila]|uniref:Mannosyl-oligosaccharide glucosidase n=1 Tax=Wickerhamiella sorbophila TaxID=45607 RepID=A0A2T0FNC8_9ASCO|nr:hypothetical protein B9G98_04095 [Wickerhamiella sorbophila]PRT56475.1 hypothetical protein B9G98_04095 [Wickerhamiella sorbophila]
MTDYKTREHERLVEDKNRTKYWKKWGPYLSERQWATVREDYSADGDAWSYFPHEHARSRAYRWGEDGIAGVSDSHARQCISFAFWNERDGILKERLFGLTGHEGNHGEDVKEEYFYVDNTPTHSYMNYLYKYPQREFPYEKLKVENANRSRMEPEYELQHTGIFEENRYFDIFIETAKDDEEPETMYFKITAYNRGPEPASLHLLPQSWFRNTWSWGDRKVCEEVPKSKAIADDVVETHHNELGTRYFHFETPEGTAPQLLFTDNVTNKTKLYGESEKNESKYVKDAFHEHIVDAKPDVVNPERVGTKFGAWYEFKDIPAGEAAIARFSFSKHKPQGEFNSEAVDMIFDDRLQDADDFYYSVSPMPLPEDVRIVQRQAFAGMCWTKQYFNYVYTEWADGDDSQVPPPPQRRGIRNTQWKHLYIDDVLSMPDKWEYPFFAVWDTAFHCLPLAMIDPEFAKKQLDLMTREWYMHPNGQIPAYEWNYSDVNPPVHAWATFRVFKIERRMTGKEDLDFLERVFQKLLLNFTWWVNRKDQHGRNVFEGGFLGLDNIGLFNRSEPLPTGGVLEQADGTGWMGFYALQMLNIALELSKKRPVYEDIASKFFEHFLFIADAMSYTGKNNDRSLWSEEDGFYYDVISWADSSVALPVRSLVGLIPLFASLTLDADVLVRYPKFARRVAWFIENRPEMSARNIASLKDRGTKNRLLLSLVNRDRLKRILERMLDPKEFLSDFGIRSMSKYHKDHPYSWDVNGQRFVVDYVPGDSTSGMFGGNSNWRGPIWFPTNFLLVESLQRFYLFYGDDFKVEIPGHSEPLNLAHAATDLQHRLIRLFLRDEKEGRRPYNGGEDLFDFDQHFDDLVLYHEFFDPDTGRGLGTKHQNGWTGLVAKLIHDTGMSIHGNLELGSAKEAAKAFFDEEFETKREAPRSRHHGRRNSRIPLSRTPSSTSTHQVVQSIGNLLEKYQLGEEDLEDLESSQRVDSTD